MSFISSKIERVNSTRGQTALSLIFIVGGIIVLFGITLAFLTLSFLNSTYGFQAANRAEAVASGGVDDVMLQLARNKNFSSFGYCLPYNGTLPCPAGSAQIVVTQDSPFAGQVTATSVATVSNYTRKIEAIFSVDSITGLVRILSSRQIPI